MQQIFKMPSDLANNSLIEERADAHVGLLLLELWRLQPHKLAELREHLLPESPAAGAADGAPLVLGAGRRQDQRRVAGKPLLRIGKEGISASVFCLTGFFVVQQDLTPAIR